jgi:omega-6 fatty acid desaturase (delta-12 desaturase)
MANDRRPDKELILATKPFTVEDEWRSRSAALFTFGVLALVTLLAGWPLSWPLRLGVSVLEGLVIVRVFCLFHDVQHGALLRGSSLWRGVFWLFGELILVPPSVWRETHNYHHAHTAKLIGSHIGSYAMLTPRMYEALSPRQRWLYRATRHPLNVLFALLTIFLVGMCLHAFARAPRKHPAALLSPLLVAALAAACVASGRPDAFVFAWLIPMAIAAMLGAYLFYAQHNFPAAHVAGREEWTFSGAALDSSSFMEMGPLMRWFTANIGYHHVHHLNAAIPFYRLPEAMQAVPELQHPGRTSLKPKDIAACFHLKLWEPEADHLVGYPAQNLRP